MNRINFLPPSYLHRRAKRKRTLAECLIVIFVGGILLIWSLAIHHSATALALQAQNFDSQLAQARAAMDELDHLKSSSKQLQQQLRIQRELVQPVNQTQIMATLSQLLPASVSITEMRVAVNRRAPEPYRTAAQLQAQAEAEKRAKAKAPPPVPPQFVDINFMGVAAEENDVADFLGALSSHPIFANVKVHYSRSTEFLQWRARDFRMSVQVVLDREYRPARQEVADAN
jgi:Tfp pilus assembly protein PilN